MSMHIHSVGTKCGKQCEEEKEVAYSTCPNPDYGSDISIFCHRSSFWLADDPPSLKVSCNPQGARPGGASAIRKAASSSHTFRWFGTQRDVLSVHAHKAGLLWSN
eukprot:1151686-Pelagomonas_calceolata.AAC.13